MRRLTAMLGLAFLLCLFITPTAQAVYPKPPPTVIIDNTNPTVGQNVVVAGSNWCPGTTVTIYVNGVEVGTAVVGSDGSFSTTVHLPPGAGPGPVDITVVGIGGGADGCAGPATVTQTVYVSATGGGGGGNAGGGGGNAGGGQGSHELPFTGSNISLGVLILAALIAVGVVSLIAGRRRNAHAPE